MKLYSIQATATAHEVYYVYANSPDEARQFLEDGEFDSCEDHGHDNMEIVADPEELAA